MSSPVLVFNYDISCPFAYIASTRVRSLAARTNATLIYRPVLLGAIYRATAAPQGASGSASDVFNPTKKAVTSASMSRTLKRYKMQFNQPPQHPRKSVDALRLLYCIEGEQRVKLTEKFFEAYWVAGRDVTCKAELLAIAQENGITQLTLESFNSPTARKELETATAEAISRGAFGVPGFWIPDAQWTDINNRRQTGRFFWGQDRMHFVEATLLTLGNPQGWCALAWPPSLLPRCIPASRPCRRVATKLQFWFDLSSPWAFLAYTQLPRLRRRYSHLQIEMKPFLLGILFREIGAPNMPMLAASPAKAAWSTQDLADWTAWWNAVGTAEEAGARAQSLRFTWPRVFPIRTPTALRVGLVQEKSLDALYAACWQHDKNVSDERVLAHVLTRAGYDGPELVRRANEVEAKARLRGLTAEAKALGICGVPTYRVLRDDGAGGWKPVGGLVWGQDETNVVEDLIMGWDPETSEEMAEVRTGEDKASSSAKL
ncbi:hypothetical protein ACEQ8H_004734 [Pleosporales sp. CAS-2024a]